MANSLRESDTPVWLVNKLGTSNDSWITGSICNQLTKEVLRNIKECFPDLQTQVKLKVLLNFFQIPRRLVDEWKTELEEVIEVAALDSELWVSMLAETMKTFPATSSLNTEISDYDETRPIFTDMVSDLRKFVSKHSDVGMLPLECQYLNKNALVSVVGQQPAPVKHFTLKRKPKSASLRTELLHKSADAQSSLKKASAPTIPLRSRGMPRKMTDTTPLKGIPSRMPTTGFRSPTVPASQQRPNLSRTPAGRKDGGIKLIELSEQPLGYAAAKKRKREQQLEEQQKKQEQKQQAAAAAAAAAAAVVTSTNADDVPSTSQANVGLTSGDDVPSTSTSANNSFEIKTESQIIQSIGGLDESNHDGFKTPEVPTKTIITEPSTPEYAATLTYSQSPSTLTQNSSADPKSVAIKTAIVASPKPSTSAQARINNNNNTYNHAPKRIKQEIEIKSEEIIVPANIKLEKIDTPMQTTLIQAIPAHPQPHRVIIQQQQPIVIRTRAAQQQKLQNSTTGTTTTIGGTTIKMEKLDLKPIVRVASTSTATTTVTTPSATLLTSQQLRQAATNSLVNLPNNISVKITSSKNTRSASGASTSAQAQRQLQLSQQQSQSQQQQQQQQQQPILINSSTPIILASTPTTSHGMRTKPIITSTTTTIPTHSIKTMPLSQIKTAANSGPVIISQTIIQPTKRAPQQGSSTSAAVAAATAAITANGPSTSAAAAAAAAQQQQQQQQQQQHVQVQQQQQQQQHQHVQVQVQQQQQPQTIITTHQLSQTLPQQQPQATQYIVTPPQSLHQQQSGTVTLPTLTSFAQTRPIVQTTTLYQTAPSTSVAAAVAAAATNTPTKILLKNSSVVMTPVRQQQQGTATIVTSSNPPPLVATTAAGVAVTGVEASLLNIQNVQLPNRPVTIQPASQAAQQQHIQAQLQQQQQHPHPQHTIVANTTATQQPKLSQVIMQSSVANVVPASNSVTTATAVSPMQTNVSPVQNKTKTILVTPKGAQVILRNINGEVYQQIPINNVNNLQGLTTATQGATLMTTTAAGPPGLVKTSSAVTNLQPQTIKIQQQSGQQMPTLIPTNSGQHHIIVQQQAPSNIIGPTSQTIIRPVVTTLPQGLTLIQRPGGIQQQIVQVPGQQQRTIITQPALQQQQLRPQQIVLQHKSGQQRIITTTNTNAGAQTTTQTQQIQIQQQGNNPGISRTVQLQVQQQPQPPQQPQNAQQQQQAPQRKGLSLSNEHVHKAHEMFRKANRVSRPDKALILGFMAGLRENPRPNSDNVLVIKLGESEEKVQQEDGNTALCLVESHIRLDYNTGEWKTFQNYRLLDQGAAS